MSKGEDTQARLEGWGACMLAWMIEAGWVEGPWPLTLTRDGRYYLRGNAGLGIMRGAQSRMRVMTPTEASYHEKLTRLKVG